jgi:hypothetical protein
VGDDVMSGGVVAESVSTVRVVSALLAISGRFGGCLELFFAMCARLCLLVLENGCCELETRDNAR